MKERNEFRGCSVNRCNVAALIAIAEIAGKSEIVEIICSPMFPADDVVDLVRESSIILME